ncbi:MAG: hypothetical protein ABIR62_17535 [Dokdonella sp.]|uniref:hypothetical protein n=1 Tax=Dokdonella sp. TaxID=2291710 RepID=UPI003266DDB0
MRTLFVTGVFAMWIAAAAPVAGADEARALQDALMPSRSPSTVTTERAWLAWGGEVSFGFNPDALVALGVQINASPGAVARSPGEPGRRYDTTTFPLLDGGALEILHRGGGVTGIGGGELRSGAGLVLRHANGTIDLRGFALRANPSARVGIVVVDAHGTVWFTADHAHYGFDPPTADIFSMTDMNLRLSAAFAQALGKPELAGLPIGGLGFRAHAQPDRGNGAESPAVCSAPFSGSGLVTDIQMIYDDAAHGWTGFNDSVYARRCGLPPLGTGGACTATSTTGEVVIDPDSSLRNVGTTAVAWYDKFNNAAAGVPQPPYNNDQHPYLIWNLYRVDASGRIRQIGASAVKHAFMTVNWSRTSADCGCDSGHIIYPTCEDTYSLGNNDNQADGSSTQNNLAPRSEVIPYSGVWGRCGSMWDPDCNGHGPDTPAPENLYMHRMRVSESDLMAPLATGARYFFEYWYVVRDDVNIYNTMAYREIRPQKNGASWSIALVGDTAADHDFFPGPVVNRWAAPGTTATSANTELVTPRGRVRVAVRATALPAGQWRYEYAVMNFDYAHVRVDPAHPAEPNLKLVSNHGFVRFTVPLPAGATASALRFDDIDNDAGNDWTAGASAGAVTWSSAGSANPLDWGTLYHFEFTSGAAPAAATLGLVAAATVTEGELPYTISLLGPGTMPDRVFSNGFE